MFRRLSQTLGVLDPCTRQLHIARRARVVPHSPWSTSKVQSCLLASSVKARRAARPSAPSELSVTHARRRAIAMQRKQVGAIVTHQRSLVAVQASRKARIAPRPCEHPPAHRKGHASPNGCNRLGFGQTESMSQERSSWRVRAGAPLAASVLAQGKPPNPSVNRTSNKRLRRLSAAGYLKR